MALSHRKEPSGDPRAQQRRHFQDTFAPYWPSLETLYVVTDVFSYRAGERLGKRYAAKGRTVEEINDVVPIRLQSEQTVRRPAMELVRRETRLSVVMVESGRTKGSGVLSLRPDVSWMPRGHT